MDDIRKVFIQKRVRGLLDELRKKHYEAYFFPSVEEARNFMLEQIHVEETVGIGGSVTLRDDLNIVEALRKQGNTVIDHWEDNGSRPRRLELKRAHRGVDVFLSGINAITRDGIMVNLDGGGNRVASLCSGPKRVISVCGVNKITDSMDSAIKRTRDWAAVLNTIRRKDATPCTETGFCVDCRSGARICSALLILFQKPTDIDQFTVILIDQELGY